MTVFSKRVLLGLVLAVALCVCAVGAFAQAVTSGNVAGQVTDPQGAVVPGVKITMTDPTTSVTVTTTTNNEGRYFIANVPVGTYNVTAAATGFATAKMTGKTIEVGTNATINIQMVVGQVTETVEVQASNVELQTMNATIGNTVPNIALSSLPAIGLDVSTFAVLQPGVTPDGNVAGTVGEQSTFMLDGGNNTSDMDGSMQTYTGGFGADPTGGASTAYSYNEGTLPSGVMPTPADSVEEIKTNTTNQTADFNSSSGMQVQVVTKRGTNKWHGTAYEYYLDNNFAANSWSNNCTTACGKSYTPLASWHRSWFGVAGGGPLISKKFLGGKTYFFANYQGSRWPLSVTNSKTVPGPGMLQGLLEFNNGTSASPLITVYNLNPSAVVYSGPTLTGKCSSCGLVNGVSYPVGISTVNGTSLSAGALDPRGLGINTANNPVSQMWNKYVPTLLKNPQYDYSGGDGQGNTFGYTGTEATPLSDNFGVARLDHDFGDKWHFFGSYRYYRLPNAASTTQTDVGGFLPGATAGVLTSEATNPQVPWYYVTGLTTNISSSTTNDFHYNFTRNWWAWGRAGDPVQIAGLGGALEPGGETTASLSPYNVNTQSTRTRYWDGLDHMVRDDVTSLHGNHLMQFGGSYQRNFDKHQRTDNGGGINYYPVYAPGYTSTYNLSTVPLPGSGATSCGTQVCLLSSNQATYASEYNSILGIINETQIAYTRSGPNLKLLPALTAAEDSSVIPFYNVYFSDSWHLKPSFTLTYGLGWTMEMPPYETQGRQIQVVDSSDQPLDTLQFLAARKNAALQGVPYVPPVGFALNANVGSGAKYPYKPFYGSFSPRIAAAWNPDFGDGFFGKHLFGGKSTVIRGGYGRIYGRLNGVDLVLVPLLAPGFIQPVQCFNPYTDGSCPGTNAQANPGGGVWPFRIGTDGMTAPLAAASPTLPQPLFTGISKCPTSTSPNAICTAAGSSQGLDPNFRPDRVDSITVSIQRQIGRRNSVEVGYIGRLITNEFQALNFNAVPYMFTEGNQQFQSAYAAIEKSLGCATSASACYNTLNTVGVCTSSSNCPTDGLSGAAANKNNLGVLPSVAPQAFFENALNPAYCSGYSSCTQAVLVKQFGNFVKQNVFNLWTNLDNTAATKACAGTTCHPFVFSPTMYNTAGVNGSPAGELTTGVGMNGSFGWGNYHAGFISWKMNNWHGLTSQSNLTWSKALGTGSLPQASSSITFDDPYNLKANYGPQFFDRKLVFNEFFVYEPPFYKGQSGLLGRLLGGWNIAPIFSASSGLPRACKGNLGSTSQQFGASDGTFSNFDQCVLTGPVPTDGVFAGVVGGKDQFGQSVATIQNPGAAAQYNAYKDPLAVWNSIRPAILGIDNLTGDGGYGVLRGHGFWNLDLSVKKNIKLTERFSTTLQTVFSNVLNHHVWPDGTASLASPTCLGVLNSSCYGTQINNNRQIEMGLRINF